MQKLAFFVALMVVWLFLTAPLAGQDFVAGVVLCAGIAIALGSVYRGDPKRLLDPVRWLWFLFYVPYFILYCLKANLDVAYRVLHPDVPIRPGIIKVSTTLKSDLAKTFLANSITLTPGTLTVDIIDQDLYIHWISISSDDPAEQTRLIVTRFERILARIFE